MSTNNDILRRFFDVLRDNRLFADTRDSPTPARELLTDEDNVILALQDHAGVMWQSHVAAETSWSESKASRVLSQMEEDGTIRRYRVGRQNLVSLPGHEPDCLKGDYDPLT